MDPANGFSLARVIAEHRERYVISTSDRSLKAEITGQLRYAAESQKDFPAVGDWVRAQVLDSDHAIILEVFPRSSQITRLTAGKEMDEQVIAANIDIAFIMQSVGYDLNLNRMERYLAICNQGGIHPYLLISKIDLVTAQELSEIVNGIGRRVTGIPLHNISCKTGAGLAELQEFMLPHYTYCILGSSGVGKSSLVNYLKGEEVMITKSISQQTSKGRHTTSHRELFVLPNGSLIIDTPGMREIGMAQTQGGLEATFHQIVELASQCKFSDCRHDGEPGCAIEEALTQGTLELEVFNNYRKLKREEARYVTSLQEQRRKDRAQGKFYKSVIARKKRTRDG